MTIINPNSIAGITSVTAEAGVMNFYKSDGTLAGLQLNGVNFNTATGVSTFNNLYVGGVLTYEDVKNVDSIGVITARSNVYIKSTYPRLYLQDTDTNSDFSIINSNGAFMVYDDTNSANRFTINSNGIGAFNSDLEVAGSHYITDSIIHTGDTNTKIRFPAADTITAETGGSERLRITSAGKVGIGSDNPGATLDLQSTDTEVLLRLNTKPVKNGYLDIVSDANRRGVIRFQDTGGTTRWSIGNGDSDELTNTSFHISSGSSGGGAAKLSINSSGVTQITKGTSGGATANTDSSLILDNSSHTYVQFRTPATKEQGLLFGDDADNDAGGITYVHSTNHLGFRVNADERARIDSDGRLRIGNTTQNQYTAADDLIVGTGSGDRGITLYSGSADSGVIAFSDGTSDTAYRSGQIIYSHASDAMDFRTNGNYIRLTIDSNGKIGVGLAPNAWQSSTTSKLIQIGNGSVWDYNLQQFDLGQNFYYDGSNYKYIANGYASKLAQLKSDGNFIFYNAASGTGGTNLTWLEKLRIGHGYAGTVDVKGIPAHLRLYSQRDTSDWDSTDPIGKLDFYVGDDTSNNLPYNAGFIHCLNETDNAGEPSGALLFGTTTANLSGGAVERLRITSGGQLVQTTTHTSGTSAHQNTSWYGDDANHYNIEIRDFNEMYATKTLNTNTYNSIIYKREKMTHYCDIEFMLAGQHDSSGSGNMHLAMTICGDGSDTWSNFDRLVFRPNGGTASNNQIRVDRAGGGSGFNSQGTHVPQFFDGQDRHIQIKIRGRRYSVYSDGVEIATEYSNADNPRQNGFFGFAIYEASSLNPWIKIRDFKLQNYSLNTCLPSYDVVKNTTASSNSSATYEALNLNNPKTVEIRFWRLRHSGGDGYNYMRLGSTDGYITTSVYSDIGMYHNESGSFTSARGSAQSKWCPFHWSFNNSTNYVSGVITVRRIQSGGNNTNFIYDGSMTVDYDSNSTQYHLRTTGQMTFPNTKGLDRLKFYNGGTISYNYGGIEILAQH